MEPVLSDTRVNVRASLAFFAVHLLPLLVFVTGVTRTAVVLGLVTYGVRTLAITGGYHRYFSHRSYRLGRVSQFVVAFVGTTAVQNGPLWWAAQHRQHHRHTDTDQDIHSPRQGVWWSHAGWILCDRYKTADRSVVRDLAAYPELRFLDDHNWIGPWALGIACFALGGWSGLIVGFFTSTVLLWHATFAVNSVAHLVGTRPYPTRDSSRNNPVLALVTFGEGWHNNHHRYPNAARQGHRWWQLDPTYYLLALLSRFRIVSDLRPVPTSVLAEARAPKRRHHQPHTTIDTEPNTGTPVPTRQ